MIGATLFSGIGAPEAAMPHWDWRWHAEIEKFPSAVMAARHPQSINLGDVSADDFTQRAEEIGRPDVLVFGSPCQSYSIAGKRLGLDDPRGNLALVALGIVDRLKPDWFVFENVPGLFSSFSGSEHAEREVREGPVGGSRDGQEDRDFATFLSRVRELGYFGCWAVLDAQYRGVAQRRDRVFFVGNSRDWRASAAVLLEPQGVSGNLAPRREAGKDIAPCLSARTQGGGGLGTDFDLDGGVVPFDTTQITSRENRCQPRAGEPCHPLAAQGHPPAVAFDMRGREGGAQFEGPHDTANLRAGSGGSSRSYVAEMAVRRLTPRECERLQDFEDDYTLIEYRGKPAADGPRYKALGNSMAVPVIRHVLARIELFETQVRPKMTEAA